MPPQAESNPSIEDSNTENIRSVQRNVTFAINYQLYIVDEFVGAPPRRSRIVHPELMNSDSSEGLFCASSTEEEIEEKTRRSNRDKQGKREVPLARIRVRYDMQTVPFVERNKDFLLYFGRRLQRQQENENPNENNLHLSSSQPRRSSRLSQNETTETTTKSNSCNDCDPIPPPFLNCSSLVWVPSKRSEWEDSILEMTALCTTAARRRTTMDNRFLTPGSKKPTKQPAPLSRDYISDRVDIDDPLNGYQIRHAVGGWLQGFLMWTNFTTWTHYFRWDSLHPQSGMDSVSGDFVDRDGSLAKALESLPRTGDPLISGIIFENIAEIGLVGGLGCGEYLLRMALDDIRSQKQYKFVVLQATESSRPFYEKFGFVRVGAICRYHSNKKPAAKKPRQGQKKPQKPHSLVTEIQPSEPPQAERRIDEVQAPTDTAPTRNGREDNLSEYREENSVETPVVDGASDDKTTSETDPSSAPQSMESDEKPKETTTSDAMAPDEPPIVGYRHWTHANESDASLQMHGGPSYMMCLNLSGENNNLNDEQSRENVPEKCSSCSKEQNRRASFLDAMMSVAVKTKPLIEQLTSANGSSVFSKTLQRRSSSLSATPLSANSSPAVKKKTIRKSATSASVVVPGLEILSPQLRPTNGQSLHPSTNGKMKRRASSLSEVKTPPVKRRKIITDQSRSLSVVPVSPKPLSPRSCGETTMDEQTKPPSLSTRTPTVTALNDKTASHRVQDEITPKHENPSERTSTSEKGDRIYYSVRGTDGRFTRTYLSETAGEGRSSFTSVSKSSKRVEDSTKLRQLPKRKATQTLPQAYPSPSSPRPIRRPNDKPLSTSSAPLPNKKAKSINPAELRKQKVKAYPRARPHFYNRVVKPIKGTSSLGQYFFVLNYNEDAQEVRLVPMVARGTMMGKRQGRPRYVCCIGTTDENFTTASSQNYKVVPATMVMKTPYVAQEAWDIEDEG